MKLLTLDLGTSCGWCIRDLNSIWIHSGVWNLRGGRFEGGGMRYLRFRNFLAETLPAVQRVAYEEVRRHMGVDAAHVYGGLQAVLCEECERRKIPYEAIPVQTIKRTATGKGNAKKDAMIAAANAAWPSIQIEDDNHADALWISETVARAYGCNAGASGSTAAT